MKYLLACALVLVGCATPLEDDPETYDFRADDSFTQDEQIAIRDYFSQLSEITETPISVTFDFPHPKHDVSWSGDELGEDRVIVRSWGHGGLWTSKHRTIRVGTGNNTYKPGYVAVFASHEVAHDMGLKHVNDPAALMNPLLGGDHFRWNQSDQNECYRVHVCKSKELK